MATRYVLLSDDDLEDIKGWYDSAAWESASHEDTKAGAERLKDLLVRLGIPMNDMDESSIAHLEV